MFAVFVSLIQSIVCSVITYWKMRVVLSDSVVSLLLKHVVKDFRQTWDMFKFKIHLMCVYLFLIGNVLVHGSLKYIYYYA